MNIDTLAEMLRTEAHSCPSFDIHISGLGSFPSLKRPRVLLIGIQAPAELEALQRGIESATASLGYESERRGFSPHLTLGRVKQNQSKLDQQKIRKALEETKINSFGTTSGRLGTSLQKRIEAIRLGIHKAIFRAAKNFGG